jgi:hypothetical protein
VPLAELLSEACAELEAAAEREAVALRERAGKTKVVLSSHV